MKNLRNFWALPAFLRLSLAFSVQDDLLAFPQYEVRFLDSYVPESYASSRLALAGSHHLSTASSAPPPDSQETQELSAARGAHANAEDAADDLDPDAPATYEAMLLGGERYLCRIPLVDKAARDNGTEGQTASSADEEERELMRVTDRGWELLQGMKGNCIYYLSGWWSYSFCYNKEVKQFHQLPPGRGVPAYPPVEDTQVQSYVLGTFPKKDGSKDGRGSRESKDDAVDDDVDETVSKGTMELAKLQTKGETRYMVQKLGGGTKCDLTGKERKIEVQFHCNPSSGDRIGMIKEVATCSYLMVIYTPRLCNDVAFMPVQKDTPNTITCRAIYPDGADFSKLRQQEPLAHHEAETEAEPAVVDEEDSLAAHTAPSAPYQTVGGIVVGAHISVGGPGKVIEKGVVVGGGKETVLGVVADSEGRQMSERDMRKLSIRNPADVEKLKRELIDAARGKGWRLELVETPRGREYRGIIDGDEEPSDDAPEKKNEDGSEAGRAAAKDEGEGSEEVYKEDL